MIIGISCQRAQIDVYDAFEASGMNEIWSAGRMELHSFEVQSKIARKGTGAAKITLNTGDVVETATDKDKASERDELMEIHSLYSVENFKYEYQFSMLLPEEFPIVPVRLVIAQWKQYCPLCSCSEYSPILAVRYTSGKLFITLQTDSGRRTLYELNEDIRNRWLDFRFQVRFSRQSDGEVRAFINNKEIINYTGITSYSEHCGFFSKQNRYYFKMGLYRDRMLEPMTIYIDEYRKKEIAASKE
jgi:hypothetical protein